MALIVVPPNFPCVAPSASRYYYDSADPQTRVFGDLLLQCKTTEGQSLTVKSVIILALRKQCGFRIFLFGF
jgi:hypothetical protein